MFTKWVARAVDVMNEADRCVSDDVSSLAA